MPRPRPGRLVVFCLSARIAWGSASANALEIQDRTLTVATLTDGTLSFTKRPEVVANGNVSYAIEISTPLAKGLWTAAVPDVNDDTIISYTFPDSLGRLFARSKILQNQ
ncbi:MAG: hypothetical protein WEB53_14895 [Akkermansiaceae bacterium]